MLKSRHFSQRTTTSTREMKMNGTHTLHIDTLILPAIVLKIVSLYYLSLRAAWASRADNFQNYGGKDQCIYKCNVWPFIFISLVDVVVLWEKCLDFNMAIYSKPVVAILRGFFTMWALKNRAGHTLLT